MTKTFLAILTGGAVVAALSAAPSEAADWRGVETLSEGRLFTPPEGHRRLCEARPALCAERDTVYEVSRVLADLAQDGAIERRRPRLTRAALRQLRRVNRSVNRLLTRRDEPDDVWSFSATEGDCEEFVLLKRETLASLGWPRTALRIAVVRTEFGVDHAVLVVKTEFEDVVLDNLRDDIVGVGASSHRFIAAESSLRPGRWVQIAAPKSPAART